MQLIYGLIPKLKSKKLKEIYKNKIHEYALDNDCQITDYLQEDTTTRSNDKIIKHISSVLNTGDMIMILDMFTLGNSTYKILSNILFLVDKRIAIHCINSNNILFKDIGSDIHLINAMSMVLELEGVFIGKKINSMKNKRKTFGRKKGQLMPSMYDKHKKRIRKLYEEGESKAEIIRCIGIGTPQSLGNYIITRRLDSRFYIDKNSKITDGFDSIKEFYNGTRIGNKYTN